MNSILLIIEKPANAEAEANQDWLHILGLVNNHIQHIENDPNEDRTKKLAESILLIDPQHALPLFVNLTSKAQSAGFSYRVLFLDKEPQIVLYEPPVVPQ